MFARVPFGLKPLRSVFQRGISTLPGPLLFCRPCIDDFSVGVTFGETLANAKALIQVLTHNIFIIINRDRCRCRFLYIRIGVLGFIVSEHGRRVNTKRFSNSRSWAPPINAKDIRRCLGTFNQFRKLFLLPAQSSLCFQRSHQS